MHVCRTMSRRQKQTYTGEEVLAALFALSSDDESDDNLEDSEDEGDDDSAGTATNSLVEVETSDTDDDDILYKLADPDASMDWSDQEESDNANDEGEDGDSQWDDPEWHKTPFSAPNVKFDNVNVVPRTPFLDTDGPCEFFEKFFEDDVIKLLVDQTNLYAQQRQTRYWNDVTYDEMKCFLGVLLGMGVHRLPKFKLYWSTDPFFHVQGIADVMPRNRFMKLLNNFHVSDNSVAVPRDDPAFDKLRKIRPLLTKMNSLFQQHAVSTYSQSIDEAMIKFKGRSSLRQYMPLKPTKRGYKVWVRAHSKSGYVYQFDIYTGKDNSGAGGVGLGDRVVKFLTETLNYTNTHVTFDNFFSSVALLDYLFGKNIFATCTVRSSCCNLPVIASVQDAMARGESKWCTRNGVGYVKWKDTKIVHVMSTAFSPNTILNAKRTQKDGTSALVECPQSVVEYTKRMGGVDRFDRSRGHYSVSHKARRWWIRIFYFLLDTAVVNAFILYQSVHPENPMTLLTFRVALFRRMVSGHSFRCRRSSLQGSSYVKYRVCGKKRMKTMGVPDSIRLQQGNHFPIQTSKFRRCRLCSSRTNNKRSRIICGQCNVSLCVAPCFGIFHNN